MVSYPKSLNEYVRAKRLEKGLSQKQLAKKLGYTSPQYVANWEAGRASVPYPQLRALIRILGLAPRQIVVIEVMRFEQEMMKWVGPK